MCPPPCADGMPQISERWLECLTVCFEKLQDEEYEEFQCILQQCLKFWAPGNVTSSLVRSESSYAPIWYQKLSKNPCLDWLVEEASMRPVKPNESFNPEVRSVIGGFQTENLPYTKASQVCIYIFALRATKEFSQHALTMLMLAVLVRSRGRSFSFLSQSSD